MDRDMTLTALSEEMSKKLNRKYSLASLSQKLRNGTIPYSEVKLIAKILGYEIKFCDIKRDKSSLN